MAYSMHAFHYGNRLNKKASYHVTYQNRTNHNKVAILLRHEKSLTLYKPYITVILPPLPPKCQYPIIMRKCILLYF